MWKRYKLLHDFNDRFRREFFLAVRCQCRRCAIWRRPAKRLAWWAEIIEREHLDEKHSPLLIADNEGLEPKFRQQITNRLREFRT